MTAHEAEASARKLRHHILFRWTISKGPRGGWNDIVRQDDGSVRDWFYPPMGTFCLDRYGGDSQVDWWNDKAVLSNCVPLLKADDCKEQYPCLRTPGCTIPCKRYIAFLWQESCPAGGWNDVLRFRYKAMNRALSWDRVSYALTAVEKIVFKMALAGNDVRHIGQIVDLWSGEVCHHLNYKMNPRLLAEFRGAQHR